jgi:DNA primase
MAFPPGFLDELRSRISLPALVGRRVRLVRKGREHAGLCPFHNEKTPSFYVVEDKGFFHCFGCGAHGDALGFTMRADNLDFIEAVERLAAEAGLPVPQATPHDREHAQRQKTLLEALAAASGFYEAKLWAPGGAPARDYLFGRGLDEEAMRRFRLGWAPGDRHALRRALAGDFPEALLTEAGLLRRPDGGGDPYDYFRERVIFPIGDRAGRPIAFGGRTITDAQPKYLNSPEHPLFEKGRVLYGWSQARANAAREADAGGPGAIVTEGYMDVIALHRAGFTTAVAPLGTALTEAQLHELWRLAPEPVLCFDGDAAGQRAALRALRRALPLLQPGRSLRFASLPAGEDPDSLLRRGGRAAFEEVLAAAQPMAATLCEAQFAARPADTPERRADLERRLMEDVALIADRTVQAEYRRFLRDRLFAAARPAGRRGVALRPLFVHEGRPAVLPAASGTLNSRVFLGVLIRHPEMIHDWAEELAAIEVPEPALEALKRKILEIVEWHSGLDAAALQQHLGSCGFADLVGVLSSSIARHAAYAAGGGDDPDVIKLYLRETLDLLQARRAGDVEAAERAFAADASDENWQRLRALKEREVQDGPIGGTGW